MPPVWKVLPLASRIRRLLDDSGSQFALLLGKYYHWHFIYLKFFVWFNCIIIDDVYDLTRDRWTDDKLVPLGLYRLLQVVSDLLDSVIFACVGQNIPEEYVYETICQIESILEESQPYIGGHSYRSVVTRKIIVGTEYKKKAEQLIELLLDPNSSLVIPILGKPGVGKSTLLGLACDDERIKDYFMIRSCHNMSGITYQYLVDKGVNLTSVVEESGTYRVLLAIDDLSDAELFRSMLSEHGQHPVYSAFLKGAPSGSKIVITSSLELQSVIGALTSSVSLSRLDEFESWNLFQRTAFNSVENARLPSNLSDIGLQICQKCDNIPAVIVIIAAILSSKSTEEWKHFLDVVMTSVPDLITAVTSMPRIATGHSHCPKQTLCRLCFAWCSLLPKDYTFTKDEIFHLWRAQHRIFWNPIKEDDGRWFDEFLRSGYFVKDDDSTDSTVTYKFSYLGSELMKHVAGDSYCLVDSPIMEIDDRIIRHVSFIVDPSWEPPSWLPKAKRLQSLLLWPRQSSDFVSLSRIASTLSGMTHLRALHAEVVHCESLPVFLAKFENLKYLRLGIVSSISLPQDNPALDKLLNNDPYYNSLIGSQPRLLVRLVKCFGFSKLKIQYEKCHGNSLENAQHIMESLNMPSSLDGDNGNVNSRYPHQTLECIELSSWKGETWPINELSVVIRNLVSMEIAYCSGFQHLPSFSTLPQLSSLQLRGLYSLVNIVISHENNEASTARTLYPSLKYLVLCDLPELIGWSPREAEPQEYCFPVLTQVQVKRCPKLVSMPSVPMLVSLEAIDMDAKCLKDITCPQESSLVTTSADDFSPIEERQEPTETTMEYLSHIQSLGIGGCKDFNWGDSLTSVEKGVWRALRCLRSLKLTNIVQLVSLPMDLEYFAMLEDISLHWLPNLKVLPEWIGQFTQLRQLTIHYCPKLTTFPKSLGNFSALELLEIRYCPRLSEFPESFPKLKRLRVQEFNGLEPILCASQNVEELEIVSYELDWDTQNTGSFLEVWKALKRIHSMKVSKLTKLEPLLDGLQYLTTLERLSLSRVRNMVTLPEWFQSLTKIQQLCIQLCPNLTKLPESFSNLSSLQQLRIEHCPKLNDLSSSFGHLSALEQLHIQCCPELTQLPETFSNLSSLQQLRIEHSPKLNDLSLSFGHLSALEQLHIQCCPELTQLPESFSNLSSLQQLRIERCPKLTDLSQSFGLLSALEQLHIQGCPELTQFPESIRELKSLNDLKILECVQLEQRCLYLVGECRDLICRTPNVIYGKWVKQDGRWN